MKNPTSWLTVFLLLTVSTCLHSEVRTLTLDGVEGYWMTRPDLEEFTLAAAESEQWQEAYSNLDTAYKDLSGLYMEDEAIIKRQKDAIRGLTITIIVETVLLIGGVFYCALR